MIRGLGIDIVDNSRIKDIYKKYKKNFLRKFLTNLEIKKYGRGLKEENMGGIFAAKEALIKAYGSFYHYPVSLTDFAIMNDSRGVPVVLFSKKELKRYNNSERLNIHVSISHEQEFTVAVVICEKV